MVKNKLPWARAGKDTVPSTNPWVLRPHLPAAQPARGFVPRHRIKGLPGIPDIIFAFITLARPLVNPVGVLGPSGFVYKNKYSEAAQAHSHRRLLLLVHFLLPLFTLVLKLRLYLQKYIGVCFYAKCSKGRHDTLGIPYPIFYPISPTGFARQVRS